MIYVKPNDLEKFINDTFTKVGLSALQSKTIANHMIFADTQGTDAHGILRLPIYIKRIQKKLINPEPKLKWERETNNSAVLDGDNGMGHYTAHVAMEKAIEKAKQHTIGFVTARNGNHYGAAASFTKLAADKKFIGFATTNAYPLMTPTGGRERVLGNNPISISVPREPKHPIILDISCSNVAMGKLILAEQKKEKIPYGWAVDKCGEPTNDPYEAFWGGGALVPVGEHKGYGIALIMEILAGVLSGALYGKQINNLYQTDESSPEGVGYVMAALNIEAFMPEKNFNKRLEDLISMIVNSEKKEGVEKIYIPGEIENNVRKERELTDIPINNDLLQQLKALNIELQLESELFM